jgi:hypothetical protein
MLSPFVEKVRLHERARFLDGREKSPPMLLREALRWARPGLSPRVLSPVFGSLKVLPAGSPVRICDEKEKVTPGYFTLCIAWRHLLGRLVTKPGPT